MIQVFDPKKGRLCNYSDAKDKGIDSHRHIIQVITQIMLHEGIDILRITEIFESIGISSTANPKTPAEDSSHSEQSSPEKMRRRGGETKHFAVPKTMPIASS